MLLTSSHRTTNLNSTGPSSASSSLSVVPPSSNPRKRSRSPSSSSSKSPHPSRSRPGSPFIDHTTSSPPRAVPTLPIQVPTPSSTLSLPSGIVPSSSPNPSPSSSLSVSTTTQENPISSQTSTEGLKVKEEVEEATLEVARRQEDGDVLPSSKAPPSSSSAAEQVEEGEHIVEASRREDRETSTRPASSMSGVESSSESLKGRATRVCERCETQNVPCIRPSAKLDSSRPVVSSTPLASSRAHTPPSLSSDPSSPNHSTLTPCNGCISGKQDCVVDGVVVASRSTGDAAASSRPVASFAFAHRLPSPPATSTDVSDRPHLNGHSSLSVEERWTQEKQSLTDRVGWLEGEVARLSQGQDRLLKMLEAGEKRKSKKLKVSPLGPPSEGHISSLPNGASTPVAPPGDLLGKHHLPSLSRPSSSSSSINGSAPTSRRPSIPQPNSASSLTFTLPPSTTPLPSALAALPPAPFRRPVPIHHRALPGAKEDPYNRSRHTQSPHSFPPPPPLQTQPRRASEIEQPRRSSEHEQPTSHPRRNSPPNLHSSQAHLHQPPPLRNSPASWFPGASSPFGAGASPSSSSSSSSRYPPPSGSWSSAPPPPLNRGGPPDGNWNPSPAFSRAPFGGNEHRRGSGDVTSSVATPPLLPSVLQHPASSRGAPALPPGFLSSPALSSPKPSSSPPSPPTTTIVPPITTIDPPPPSSSSSRSPLPSASSHSIASLLSASGTSSALDRRRKSFTGIGAGFQESSVRGGGEEDAVEDEDEDMEMVSPPRGGDEGRVAGKEMRV